MTPFDPFGRTIFEERRDGRTYLEIAPGQYRCDFCATPDPTWEYDCGAVAIVGNATFSASEDEWAVCEDCRALIDARNVGALVERMIAVQDQQPFVPDALRPPVQIRRRQARENVTAFLAAKLSDARPIRR